MNFKTEFISIYGESKTKLNVFFAPGRVNLIGEHIDYNGGMVFPAALSVGTKMAVRKRNDNKIIFKSLDFDKTVTLDINEKLEYAKEHDWANYPKGVMSELISEGCKIDAGFEVLFESNIPQGAGLSSSAALEVVFAFGIANIFDFEINKIEIAKLCQKAENNFIGVKCGIMDQFACALGKKDNAIMLNCDTLDYDYVPLKLGNYRLVIINSNKKRGLVDSKYNERLEECRKGLEDLNEHIKIPNLCSLNNEEFNKYEEYIKDEIVKRRVKHAVSENERVKLASEALNKNDLIEFGKLMKLSHISLRDDYEVTGFELDTLFDEASKIEGCIGTRMTGAGFGGCNVSLVHKDNIENFKSQVYYNYKAKTGLEPQFYVCEPGDGVKVEIDN